MVYCKRNKPSWLPELKLAFNFACKHFGLNPSKVKIKIEFLPQCKYKLPQKGYFLHLGSKPISISIEKLLTTYEALETLFHEITHWSQCVKGAFKKGDDFFFEREYSLKNLDDYLNHPSEVEARSQAFLLMQKWAEIRKQKLKNNINK